MIFLAKGRLVTLADGIAQELARFTLPPESDFEAGGILLGQYRGPHVEILRCTAPMPKDRRSRYGFVRRDKGHQEAASNAWRESGGSVNFVGEWHTHPERHPTPSWIDRRSWSSQLKKHKTDPLIFIIAGSATTYCEFGSEGQMTRMKKIG